MNKPPSRAAIIRAIVWKDLREFARDRLWIILVPISLASLILLFYVLPKKVNETIAVGIAPQEFARILGSMAGSGLGGQDGLPGLEVVPFESGDQLAASVSGELSGPDVKKVTIGIAFPDNFLTAVGSGETATVSVYVDAAVPDVISHGIMSGIREMAYAVRSVAMGRNPLQALPVTLPELQTITLGEDFAGAQVPLREKMRPFLVILILLIESLALAGLVAVEIEHRTVTSLLITPARTGDFLAAKCITGMILALSQGLFFLVLTRSFAGHGLIVLLLMVIGSAMASAVGMLAGAAGKEFMSTLFYGMVFITPMMIPAFSLIFPGSAALWIKALPSYGLIQGMVGTISYGRGWAETLPHIVSSLAWVFVMFGAALLILKRRVEAL